MTATVHIEAEEWMMAAGLIGLHRLYPDDRRALTRSGYQLTPEHLDGLAHKYVAYLLDHYSVAKRDAGRMSWYIDQLHFRPAKIKDYATDLRKMMNDQVKKVEKYFSDREEYTTLGSLVETMKVINTPEDRELLEATVKSYSDVMSTPYIDEKLTMNYVRSVILEPFFGQASILQKTFSSKSIDEHIEQIHIDFVEPAQLELAFQQMWQSGDPTAIQSYLEHNQHYAPFKTWHKGIKKCKTIEELDRYCQEEMLPCSLINGLFGTQSLEEKSFVPLAFSKDKAVNFSWDFEKSCPVPISAVARLILFLAPLGLTPYTRRVGSVQANENYRYFGLVLTKKNFVKDVKLNNNYLRARSKGTEFTDAIIGLFHETTDKADKLKDALLMIELSSEYQAKKTLLDYYHMPSYLVSFFNEYAYLFKGMKHSLLKDRYLREILKGIDPKQVIYEYIRMAIKESFHVYGAYQAVKARYHILNSMRGVDEMASNDKAVTFVYFQGVNLRKQLVGRASTGDENAPYRASGSKKVEGIAYRLLNAVKSGDKSEFMDSVFRLYLSANAAGNKQKLSVPSIFLDGFKEEGLDFDTLANAFITGLLSQDEEKKEEASTHES